MTGIIVLKCTCEHEFQDRIYGKFRRVHNLGKIFAFCTVCGDKKRI